MPTQLSIPEIIEVAKVSQELAQNDIAKGSLFGKRIDERLGKMLYMERKSLEWLYDLDNTNTTLRAVGDYVYDLCGNYGLKAQQIIATSGGGSAVNPSNPYGYVYDTLELLVNGESGNPTSGEYTYQNDLLIGATDLRFIIVDNVTETNGADFTFNSITGTITRNNQFIEGSRIVIPFNRQL